MISQWFFTGGDSGTGLYRVEIEENKITSMSDDDVDNGIRVPFRLEINTDWHKDGINLEPVVLYTTLSCLDNKTWLRIAEAHPAIGPNRSHYFDFPLSLGKVELLENLRQGKELQLKLDIVCTFSASERGEWNNRIPRTLITNVFNRHAILAFTVPKSIWEEKVLSGLGIDALHSVTIKIPPSFGKAYAGPLRELTEAIKTLERATSESDFESVVSKARITIESLLDQFSLQLPKNPDGEIDKSFKAKVNALRDQFLIPVLGNTHAEHVAAIINDLWSPFSGAAHPGPSKFDRAYARFSIHQAAALLSIVSETLMHQG
jgi:hypothetical protein